MRPVRARACGLPTKATFVRVQQLQIGYELPALHAQQRSADAWSGSVHGGHGPPSERSGVGDLLVPQRTPYLTLQGRGRSASLREADRVGVPQRRDRCL